MLKRYNEWRDGIQMTGEAVVTVDQLLETMDGASAVNSYTLEDWMGVPGIGETLAQRILESGPFSSLEEVRQVRGVGEKVFERILETIQ